MWCPSCPTGSSWNRDVYKRKEWDETAIRQLVAQVKVLSKNEISVTLKSGIEIRQSISN